MGTICCYGGARIEKRSIRPLLKSAGAKIGVVEAAGLGEIETLASLLDEGAEVDSGTGIGITPLMSASMLGHAGCIEALLERGANIDATGISGETTLSKAVSAQRIEIVSLLLNRGADLNHSDVDGVLLRIRSNRKRASSAYLENLSPEFIERMNSPNKGHTPLRNAALGERRIFFVY